MIYQPSPSELEHVACPARGTRRSDLRYDLSRYRVMQCLACARSYLSPRLNDAATRRFYDDDAYFENGDVGCAG